MEELIGKEMPGPDWYVERGKIAEFAAALGDLNDLYFSKAAAQAEGLPDVVAPPTFAQSAGLQVKPGTIQDPRALLGLDMKRVLHGEQEFIFRRPIFAGEVLHSVGRIHSITEREGKRGGKMRLVTFDTIYRDDEGNDVLIVRNTLIERGAPPSAS